MNLVKRSFVILTSGYMLVTPNYVGGSSTWSGATSSNMSNSGNWSSGGVPSSGTSTAMVFPNTPTTFTVTNNIGSNFLFGSIQFTGASGGYTLGGSSFLITSGSSISFAGPGTNISAPLQLAGTTAALNITSVGTSAGTGNTISGGITSNAQMNLNGGYLTVSGTNSFSGSGGIQITAGASSNTTLKGSTSLGAPSFVNLIQAYGSSGSAALDMSSTAQSIGSISSTTGATIGLGAQTLTVTSGGYQAPFYGTLTGTGTLSLPNSTSVLALMSGSTAGYSGNVSLNTGGTLLMQSLGGVGTFTFGAAGAGGALHLTSATSAMSNNITMSGQTAIVTSGSATNVNYTGQLSGAGPLVKLGLGTLSLANTTSAPASNIQIQGGILNVGSTSYIPTGSVTFESYGGTLEAAAAVSFPSSQSFTLSVPSTFDTQSYSMTIGGPISGGSKLVKKGTGTLYLNYPGNVYTGKTVIQNGVLNSNSTAFTTTSQLIFQSTGSNTATFQAGSDFSSFTPPIILQSPATFDTQAYNVTLNGLVTGGYTMTKTGTGTLTFGYDGNNYSGNVQINNGTVNGSSGTISDNMPEIVFAGAGSGIFQAGSDFTALPCNVVLQEDGTIDTQTYNVTITGSLIGEPTYTLSKLGSGTLTINGQVYFPGTMDVLEGNIHLNGLSANDLTVRSGSRLKGTGTNSGGVTVHNGGIIAPGNSVGTMTVGSLTLNPSSITLIEMDASAASSINVTGSATVNGALQVVPDVAPYPRQGTYTIISANSLSGNFTSVNSYPGFTFSYYPQGNNLYLNYSLAIPTSSLTGNTLTYANYLNSNAPPSNEYTLLAELTGDALVNGVNSASPARNAFGPFVTDQTVFALSGIVNGHMANHRFMNYMRFRKEPAEIADFFVENTEDCLPNTLALSETGESTLSKGPWPYEVWIGGFVEFAHQAQENQNPSFNFVSEGFLAAFDYTSRNYDVMAGGGLGFAHSQVTEENNAGDIDIPYYFLSGYATFNIDRFYLEPALWIVFNQIYNQRNIIYSGENAAATATINEWQLNPHLGFGYDVVYNWCSIEPFIALDWAINWEGGCTEAGGGALNVVQNSNTSSMLQSEIGIRFYQYIAGSSGRFGFKESASYINRAPFGVGTVNAAIAGSSTYVTLTSLNSVQNLGVVNVDFFGNIGKREDVFLSLGYQGEFGSDYISNEILLRISKQF